jgi:protein-S-isoprenylcysteine O-methyltransferase Ste14
MAGAQDRTLNIPPVYFLVALVLMAFFHHVAPAAQLLVAPYRYAGIVLMTLAIALVVWAALLFRRAGTGIVPFSPATVLVTSGPYRYTRNPMYLGLAGTLLGVAVLMGSMTPFVVIPAFMALIADRFIAGEEAMLERSFGRQYLEYKSRVRRWL